MKGHRAIWLYGSHARGDVRPDSDLDVLVIADGNLRSPLPADVGAGLRGASVGRYSWDEIYGMAEYGSLFLHHLRLEGRRIFEDDTCRGRLRRILHGLPPYRHCSRDARGFAVVLNDVKTALAQRCDDPFELAVLATTIRHASILVCWLHGSPRFGRTEPVHVVSGIIGRGNKWQEFSELYRYRLYCDRRVERETLSVVDAQTWWLRARDIVDHLEEVISGNRDKMPT